MIGLILGAVGGGIVALISAVFAMETGIYLHTLSLVMVLPLGGLLIGAGAGAGFAAGTMGVVAAGTKERYAAAGILGPVVYAVLLWFLWSLDAPDAPFWFWLKATVADLMRSPVLGVGRAMPRDLEAPSTLAALASWSRFLMQFAGAAAGSLVTFYLAVHDLEPCPICRQAYRKPAPLFHLETGDGAGTIARFKGLKEEEVRAWLSAGRAGSRPEPVAGESGFAVRLVRCLRPGCGAARLSAGRRAVTFAGNFDVGGEANLELRRDIVRLLTA